MSKRANPETFSLNKVGLDQHSARHIDLGTINDVLGSMNYLSRGCLVNIKADWNTLRGDYKKDVLVITASGYSKKTIKEPDTRIRMYSHYVEAYIYYCFLALNISAPGCFTAYLSDLSHSTFEEVNTKLKICSDIYDAMQGVSASDWPFIDYVPLSDVTDWLNRVGYGTKQIACTPIEKALFSFLNLSLANDWFTEAVLWLSYSLEGLYDTPAFGIKKTLIDREHLWGQA